MINIGKGEAKMAYLTFKPAGTDGTQIAAYFTVRFTIAPQGDKFRMTAGYRLQNQLYTVVTDSDTIEAAKASAEKVVMASFSLKPKPDVPDNSNSVRQAAILRWTEAQKIYVSLTTSLVRVPKPELDDYIKDPNYVWPYMNTAPDGGNARPGGGGGTIIPPRPI